MAAADHRTERAASIASSSTEAGAYDENERLAKLDHTEDGMKSKTPEEMEMGDESEDKTLLPQETEKPQPPKNSFLSALIWMVINTLATIGIVRDPVVITSLPECLR